MSMSNYPKRPTFTDEMVSKAAAKLCSNLSWPTHCAPDIVNQYSYGMDGFDLGKALEKWASWELERGDVEELDSIDYDVRQMVKAAEKHWFATNNIQPPLPIGTAVKTRDGIGHIDAVYEYDVGRYTVKPEGQDDATNNNRRIILTFEQAEDAAIKEPQS